MVGGSLGSRRDVDRIEVEVVVAVIQRRVRFLIGHIGLVHPVISCCGRREFADELIQRFVCALRFGSNSMIIIKLVVRLLVLHNRWYLPYFRRWG